VLYSIGLDSGGDLIKIGTSDVIEEIGIPFELVCFHFLLNLIEF
jgi:hypothetical protein